MASAKLLALTQRCVGHLRQPWVAGMCCASLLGPWASSHHSLHILHGARDVSHAARPALCHDDVILQPHTSKALHQATQILVACCSKDLQSCAMRNIPHKATSLDMSHPHAGH